MKKLLFILLVNTALFAFGQTDKYPVPDFDNAPFYYNGKELVDLDAEQYVLGGRPKGLTGAESAIYINGTTSTVKVKKGEAKFIVKLEVGVDPRTLIDLNKTVVNEKSGKREYVVYKKGMFTAEGTSNVIALTFKKVSDGVYLITSKSELEAGEYFFSAMANAKSKVVYCFTVVE